MTDPDKLAAFKALAGDLGKSMKDTVVKQHEDAKALQDAINAEREKMLRLLENDIDALGWDQCPKAYAVSLAEDGTEMLNFIQDVDGDPVHHLMMLATTGELKNEAVALVLTNECWQYPDYLNQSLGKDQEAASALYRLLPPSLHPERRESRIVTLVDRTGQAVSIARERGEEPQWIGKQSGRVVDAMKCLLGIDRRFNKIRDKLGKTADDLVNLLHLFHAGIDACWIESQYVDALAEHFKARDKKTSDEEHHRRATQLMKEMPSPLRAHLGLE